MKSMLILPFNPSQSGNEGEARLGRQLARIAGKKLQASGRIETKFFSPRQQHNGKIVFINSTEMPQPDELKEISASSEERYILYGRVEASDKIILEVRLYDGEAAKNIFHKRFETYATYTFDAVEETILRVLQLLEIETTKEERVQIFRRESESWEAFLYYLMAEEDRYGLSIGVDPVQPQLAINAYLEALMIDSYMKEAEHGLIAYVLDLVQRGRISVEDADDALRDLIKRAPHSEAAFEALGTLLNLQGKIYRAIEIMKEGVKANRESISLRQNLAELYVEAGHTDNALIELDNLLAMNPDSGQIEKMLDLTEKSQETLQSAEWTAMEEKILKVLAETKIREAMDNLDVIDPRDCD